MDNTKKQRIISICSGYGGIELGLGLAGLNFRTVCYVEIEAFAQANLVAKIEQGKMDAAPIWSNLKTFDGKPFRDKVHGIIGGYPCQPFSHAGQRKGTDDPRHLWPYIEEHIRTIRPVWCFFENVGGHLTLGFEEVAQSLRDMGYKVEAGLFTAAEAGLPHRRKRLFILAYAEHDGLFTGKNSRGFRSTVFGPSQGKIVAGNAKRADKPRELAYPYKDEPSADGGESDTRADRGDDVGRGGKGLAITKCTKQRAPNEGVEKETTEYGRDRSSINRSPARPGQPQHEWEEPRTVEPGMGRTVDGFASRVDELRLLGNGVVPQTAELAFRTLWSRI